MSETRHKALTEGLAAHLIGLLMADAKIKAPTDAVVRDGLPDDDYGEGNADWETGALVDNTVATIVNGALTANKAAGFYGVAALDANPVVDVLIFRVGSATGSVGARFQLEQLYAFEEPVGFFPDPPVYGPTDTVFIEVEPRDTKAAPGDNLPLLSLVAERKGPFVS